MIFKFQKNFLNVIEVEIKLYIDDISLIQEKLTDLGAERTGVEFNEDIYLNHPNRDFRLTDEALRIRKVNSKTELTYKGPKINDKSKTREEINAEISEENILDIFYKLDFTVGGRVNKNREKWKFNDIAISLDDVEKLGSFVELEILSRSEDRIDEMITQLYDLASELGLDPEQQITKSYLELLEIKQKSN